jgi:hypothetical protein
MGPKPIGMTFATTTEPPQVVSMTPSSADVRLHLGGPDAVSIGRVGATNGRWFWQHRDGEQSSPIAENRAAAAHALAEYHRAFKPAPAAPRRTLLANLTGGTDAGPKRKLLFS